MLDKILEYNQFKRHGGWVLKPRALSRSKQSRRGLTEQKHGKPCARQTKQQQKGREQQAGVWATKLIGEAFVTLPSLACTIPALKFVEHNRHLLNALDCRLMANSNIPFQ